MTHGKRVQAQKHNGPAVDKPLTRGWKWSE